MKFLYNATDLLILRTNAWACENEDCNRTYLDMSHGLGRLIEKGDEDCRHERLERVMVRKKQ